ncbi:uncharacterized protein CG32395 [Scaptodrosophila lebanonensis]|uniref:Uncharacterized protein CG32395 n=1 Tax=Drosophila lebanonensis TaxID=7225 RepID=A0A6J2T836_DROLE|nr:uncharacterized protein CG32395 [Scaptodrosophila lebanonensis]
MKPLNLLNRCTILSLRVTLFISQLMGGTTFTYDTKIRKFRKSVWLQSHAMIFTLLLFFIVIFVVSLKGLFAYLGIIVRIICECIVLLMVRCHVHRYSDQCVRLLNEMQEMVHQLIVLAKHPNIFRVSHLLLLLLTLQSMLRSLMMLVYSHARFGFIFFCFSTSLLFAFLLQVSINICLFIVLIACYEELQQCTRRISNDVRTLRQAQVLEGGQLLVLVEQLRGITEELIRLRMCIFRITTKLIKHYRFHWLWTILYWLTVSQTDTLTPVSGEEIIYKQIVALLNIAFYCTIFEIFVWKSKLSRSFWNFHLTNYHVGFDRTIDELLHLEFVEDIKISVYGIRLDMKFLFKIVSIYILCIFVDIKANQERLPLQISN